METPLRKTEPRARRARGALAAAALTSLSLTSALPANADPASTTRGAEDFTVRPLPCSPDSGYFAVTVIYNETWRTSADGDGHFTRAATFSAALSR